jgi:hypothetical protein
LSAGGGIHTQIEEEDTCTSAYSDKTRPECFSGALQLVCASTSGGGAGGAPRLAKCIGTDGRTVVREPSPSRIICVRERERERERERARERESERARERES